MCEIKGYAGDPDCQEDLIDSLQPLAYRAYDSGGLAWEQDGSAACVQTVGNLDSLEEIHEQPTAVADTLTHWGASTTLEADYGFSDHFRPDRERRLRDLVQRRPCRPHRNRVLGSHPRARALNVDQSRNLATVTVE